MTATTPSAAPGANAPQRPETRPDHPGLRRASLVLALVAGALALVSGARRLHAASAPFADDLFGSALFGWLAGCLAAVLLAVVLILALLRKRMAWSLVAVPAVWAAMAGLASTPLPEQLRWPLIQADLERAEAAGTCPEWAGLAHVRKCVDGPGFTGYDFDGGFLDRVVVAKLADPGEAAQALDGAGTGWTVDRELGGGWYVLVFDF